MLKPSATIVFGLLVASTATATASAQTIEAAPSRLEFRITSGSLVPTGDQRDILKSANTTAASLAWLVRPSMAVVGSFSWARSRDLASVENHKLNVFTTDLGVEGRGATWFDRSPVSLRPFIGVGAGVRTYDYRKLDSEATSNLAGYGAIGGESGIGRLGVRLEVRDYISGFKPLIGGGRSVTRNDVVITAALSLKTSRSKN